MFFHHRTHQKGTLFSLNDCSNLSFDWGADCSFVPDNCRFDRSGQRISLSGSFKLVHLWIHPGLEFQPAARVKQLLTDRHNSALGFIRRYDEASFGDIVAGGIRIRQKISDLSTLLENGALGRIKNRVESLGQPNVLHIVFSPDKRLAAVVIREDPVSIEFWRSRADEENRSGCLEKWKSVCLKCSPGCLSSAASLGKFFTTTDGESEFVFYNPQSEGVQIFKVQLSLCDSVQHYIIRSPDDSPVKTIKATADTTKAIIVFENGGFMIVKLTSSVVIALRGKLSECCDVDFFVDFFIKDRVIHINEDDWNLILGWDSSTGRLVSFSLAASESQKADECSRNKYQLHNSNCGLVLWTNQNHSRAIIHTRANEKDWLFVHDTSGICQCPFISNNLNTASPLREPLDSWGPIPATLDILSEAAWCDQGDTSASTDELCLFFVNAMFTLLEMTPDYHLLNLLEVKVDEEITNECHLCPL